MIYLVVGGASSGKSEYAEKICVSMNNNKGRLIYLATMVNCDKETNKKINIHIDKRRNKDFVTIECPYDINSIIKDIDFKDNILLECLSNLVSNEVYYNKILAENCASKILNNIINIHNKCNNIIIVSNDIFSSGESFEGYSHLLGLINCQIAKIADCVVEIVYTIPIVHKKLEENKK